MKKQIFALIFASSMTLSHAAFDFIGSYECRGYDPYLNKNYTGIMIIKPQNAVYKVKMAYSTGEIYDGTAGLFEENTISVVFQDTSNLKQVGLERYSVGDDGETIEGYWVYLGGDKLGREYCRKSK